MPEEVLVCERCGAPLPSAAGPDGLIRCEFCGAVAGVLQRGPSIPSQAEVRRELERRARRVGRIVVIVVNVLAWGGVAAILVLANASRWCAG